MNKRESIDFDFFDEGGSSDRRRPQTRLADYAGGDDETDGRSAASGSARSASTVGTPVKKIEARLPSASASRAALSDSGASSDRSSSDGSGTYGSPPLSSSSGARRQISFSRDTKDPERAATKRGAGSSSDDASSRGRHAWSEDTADANGASHRKPLGSSGVAADNRYGYENDGEGFPPRAAAAAQGRNQRDNSGQRDGQQQRRSTPGGRPQDTLSETEEIAWETDSSDVSVSPLNSPDASPLVTPRQAGRAARQTGDDSASQQRRRPRQLEQDAVAAGAPCRVTRSSNEVAIKQQRQSERGQSTAIAAAADMHDEDRMSLNLLLKALLECDDRPPHGAGERRHGHSGQDKPNLLEAEHHHLLQNLLGMPSGQRPQQQKERKPRSKTQPESAVPRVTSATVNRAKEQRRIEMENLALLKRLQSAKPTRELQRKAQLQDYYRQLSYHAPQLRGGDAGNRSLSSSSAAAASCYGTKLSSKSQSLQSLRSIMSSSQRSTVSARNRPASASRGQDRTMPGGAAASHKSHPPHHGHQPRQSDRTMTDTAVESLNDAYTRWEDGW